MAGLQNFWTELLPDAVKAHEEAKAREHMMDGPRRRRKVNYKEKGPKADVGDDDDFQVHLFLMGTYPSIACRCISRVWRTASFICVTFNTLYSSVWAVDTTLAAAFVLRRCTSEPLADLPGELSREQSTHLHTRFKPYNLAATEVYVLTLVGYFVRHTSTRTHGFWRTEVCV